MVREGVPYIETEPRMAAFSHHLRDEGALVLQLRQPLRHLRLHTIQAATHARALHCDELTAMLPREVRAATDVGDGGSNLRVSKLLQRRAERLLHAIALAQLRLHVHGCEGVQVY